MKLELELSERVMKKIKAWALLSEYEGSADEALAHVIDRALTEEITATLHIIDAGSSPRMDTVRHASIHSEPPRKQTAPEQPQPEERVVAARPDTLMENTSFGLGDADEDGGSDDEEAFVPEVGGLNEEDLDRDMMVDDPEHEAVSSDYFGEPSGDASAEDMFSSQLNLPRVPQVDPGVARRDNLRKNTKNRRRAKVTSYGG